MLTNYLRLISAVACTALFSLFPFAQTQDGVSLYLGFPSHFYTIHYGADSVYGIHCGIGGLLVNICFFYALLTLISHLWRRIRKT